ncbi:putative transcription factor TCP5-like [Capsicum annuum]|nr:putative transcription factor TCP5-like [Capsicum annuum]
MERVVHPGPAERMLLRLQSDHRSEWLWDGRISLELCIRPIRIDLAWNLFTSHPPHQRVVDYLSRAGLYNVVRVGRMQYGPSLLTAMVMFGLRVDGHSVYLTDVSRRDRQWRAMLEALTGYAGEIKGRSFLNMKVLTDFIKDEVESDPVGVDTPVGRVEQIARLYMLVILGVWCWERMLPIQPRVNELGVDDAVLPYARRWTRGVERENETYHNLIPIRDQIDHMMEKQAALHSFCGHQIGEYHVPDRVMRQFDQLQHIPKPPEWDPMHFTHDLHSRLDQAVIDLLDGYSDLWGYRHGRLVLPVRGAVLRDYPLWFLKHGQLLIGNPALKVRSCIADLSAWKVKKRRSIVNSKSNSLENNVIACELESAASVLGKNNVDKGRISEMGVNTCYEGDLVMRSINIGICPSQNTCDGVEETSRKNPSKSNGTDRHLETCSDRCSGISKDRVFVTSESKFVSEVENRNEPVPNVDNSMATESGGFVEVNNTAIEMRGFQIYPRLEVLITYSRKRRKNSSASASSLPSIMKDATSSLLITENKTTTPSSDHCQVSISYSNSLPAEVNDGGDTLLMGRQQMLLVKAAVDSPSSETWNKNEAAQVDNQKETVNSSMASIKDESPIDSKAENYEPERRNETDTFVNMPYVIEFAKGSSHYAMPCDLRASDDIHSVVTTI